MGIFLLFLLWAKGWRYVILTKLGQHVNEMMAVAVKVSEFLMVRFSYNQTKR